MKRMYNVSDEAITDCIKAYLVMHPKASKMQTFKYVIGFYGAMDRDDFAASWKQIKGYK